MVDDVGPLFAIEVGDFGHRPRRADGAVPAPAPGERPELEAFASDLLVVFAHPRRHDHFEPGVAGRSRDGQTMRAEIPILGDEEEQLRPVDRLNGWRSVKRGGLSEQHAASRQKSRVRVRGLSRGQLLFNASAALAETIGNGDERWRASW